MLPDMRSALLLFLFLFAGGCVNDRAASSVVRALRFRVDPFRSDEAIEQIEFTAQPASACQVKRLPAGWNASTNNGGDSRATCLLTCGHVSFTVSDIHRFDRMVYVRIPADPKPELRLTARIWLTRGPDGPGRIVILGSDQLILQ